MTQNLEDFIPVVQIAGLNSAKNGNLSGAFTIGGIWTFNAVPTFNNGINSNAASIGGHIPVAVNATATLTAAQTASGYITSTSAAAVTLTLPTGTLLGAQLAATRGDIFELYVDNTAGANTVTMAVAVNGILSDAAATTAASFGQLTVASGVTGVARFTLMFSSATAYVFTRTA